MDDGIHTFSRFDHTLKVGHVSDDDLVRGVHLRYVAVKEQAKFVAITQMAAQGASNQAGSARDQDSWSILHE
jgi:hypothetical protein